MTIKTIVLICFCITIAGIVAFTLLGDRVLEAHEAFVSVTAREMIENDEYIIPTFNNRYRLNKTPLPYWLVVAASFITGEIDEFTARLPAATITILTVICILYFITVILDFRTAFFASLVWICSLGFIRYSHCARPEMHLTFFMLICFLSFYTAVEETNGTKQKIYSLIFWVSLGLSVLAKAPSSIFFITFSIVGYLTIFKQWHKFPKILPIWGLLVFLLIALPWPIAAARTMHWDVSLWQNESIGKLAGGGDDGGWFFYLLRSFVLVAPWIVFWPFAIAAPFFKVWKSKRKIMGYLWICFFAGVLFLSICDGKRQHYMLPLMPMAAILIGIVMEDMIFSRMAYREKESRDVLKWHLYVFFLFGLVILFTSFEPLYNYPFKLFSLPAYADLSVTRHVITGLAITLGVALSIFLYSIKRRMAACLLVFSSIVFTIVFAFSLNSMLPDKRRAHAAMFAVELKKVIPQEDDIFVLGQIVEERNEVLVYYFGRPIRTVPETSDLNRLYNNGNWLIVARKYVEQVRSEYDFREVKACKKNNGKEFEEVVIIHKDKSLLIKPITTLKENRRL